MHVETQNETAWEPDWATHPGEHLAEYLEVRSFTQAEFARVAGMTPKLVSEIISCKNPVSPETAIKLERVLGLKDYIWLGIQRDYDLHLARKASRSDDPARSEWLRRFPVAELTKIGVLPSTKDVGTLVDALLRYFGIGEVGAYQRKLSAVGVNHRKAAKHESNPDHVFAWLTFGETEARKVSLPAFDRERFLAAVNDIRKLTRDPVGSFSPKMVKLLHDAGVALVFTRPLGETRLFGSAWWIDGGQRAIIQMSLRMKSNDHFWWTFFHECGHIALHHGQNFADDERAVGDGKEDEADRWAEEILYGRDSLEVIIRSGARSGAGVKQLASALDLHPGIVVGLLQHHKCLPYTHLNGLKERYELN